MRLANAQKNLDADNHNKALGELSENGKYVNINISIPTKAFDKIKIDASAANMSVQDYVGLMLNFLIQQGRLTHG